MYYKLLFLKKSQLYSRYHSQSGALRLCLFSAAAQQQFASRHRDSKTGKSPGVPGVGAPLHRPLSGRKPGTMGGPVRPRNRLTSLVAEFAQGLEREKMLGRPAFRAGPDGGGCVLGPQPRRRAPPKGERPGGSAPFPEGRVLQPRSGSGNCRLALRDSRSPGTHHSPPVPARGAEQSPESARGPALRDRGRDLDARPLLRRPDVCSLQSPTATARRG